MSSGKTTNLELHLWENSDRFLRSEFNENSTLVDKAIGEILTERIDTVKVVNSTLTMAVASANVNLSYISVLDYWKFELMLDFPGFSGDVKLRVNGVTSGYVKLGEDSAASSSQTALVTLTAPGTQPFWLEFPHVCEGAYVGVHGSQFHYEADGSCWKQPLDAVAPVLWEDVTGIQIVPVSGTLPVGSRIVVRGVKK